MIHSVQQLMQVFGITLNHLHSEYIFAGLVGYLSTDSERESANDLLSCSMCSSTQG